MNRICDSRTTPQTDDIDVPPTSPTTTTQPLSLNISFPFFPLFRDLQAVVCCSLGAGTPLRPTRTTVARPAQTFRKAHVDFHLLATLLETSIR